MKCSREWYSKEFKKFLRNENVATQFYVNCFVVPVAIGDIKSRIKTVNGYLKSESPYNFLINSFTWKMSKEGWEFWHDLDKKWLDHMSNKIANKKR